MLLVFQRLSQPLTGDQLICAFDSAVNVFTGPIHPHNLPNDVEQGIASLLSGDLSEYNYNMDTARGQLVIEHPFDHRSRYIVSAHSEADVSEA